MMLAYNIYRIDEMAKRCSNELRSMEFDQKQICSERNTAEKISKK